MGSKYKVGLTRDILDSAGKPAFGAAALKVLEDAPNIDWEYLPKKVAEIGPDEAAAYDAIYVNAARVPAEWVRISWASPSLGSWAAALQVCCFLLCVCVCFARAARVFVVSASRSWPAAQPGTRPANTPCVPHIASPGTQARHEQLSRWLAHGRPRSFWLPGFFNPQARARRRVLLLRFQAQGTCSTSTLAHCPNTHTHPHIHRNPT